MKEKSAVRFRTTTSSKGFVKFFGDNEDSLMRMFLRAIPKVDNIDLSSVDLTSEGCIDPQYYHVL